MKSVVARVIISLERVGLDGIHVSGVGLNNVCISGTVATNAERCLAYAAVRTTPGVANVKNDITIRRAER